MTLLTGQELAGNVRRTYHIEVPADPIRATLPLILVFHGGGQDATTIAKRWSVDPPNPVPPELSQYLLVFPESDPLLPDEWVHFKAGDSAFPTHDLEFVGRLLTELTTRAFPTGSATVPTVSGDPDLVYAAGFSSGGGMVWQLLNSNPVDSFRGSRPSGQRSIRRRCSTFALSSRPSGRSPRQFRSSTSTAPRIAPTVRA